MRFKSDSRKPLQPELVASKDSSRPVLTTVHLNAEASEVWVTDSYMAARFPVELDEGDTSGPVPIEALKAMRKPPSKFLGVGITLNGNAEVRQYEADGKPAGDPYVTMPRGDGDYQFPNLEQLTPEESHVAEFSIGFNPTTLLALAKAMGSPDKIRVRFVQGRTDDGKPNGEPSPLRPMIVEPPNANEDSPSGILMPIRLH